MKIKLLVLLVCVVISLPCVSIAEQSSEYQRQLELSEQERQKQMALSEQEHQRQLKLSEQERQKQLKMSEQERQKQLTLSEHTAAWFKAWSEKWVGRFSNLIAPTITIGKWNEMLMETDMQNPPVIDDAWARNNKQKAILLQDQLTQLHSKLGEPSWDKISPENIDEYRKLINKAQGL